MTINKAAHLTWDEDCGIDGHRIKLYRPTIAQATLLSYPPNAMDILSTLSRAYAGEYTPELAFNSAALKDLASTSLQTPLEFINTVWLLQDVTRAFTHQLVRTRIGVAYVQESLRFAERRDLEVLVPHDVTDDQLELYADAARAAAYSYHNMVREGVPRQAARGVFPTNILTNIYWSVNLKTFAEIVKQRLCCQADTTEWLPLVVSMRRKLIQAMGPEVKQFLLSNRERGVACGFGASFDRPCTWQTLPADLE